MCGRRKHEDSLCAAALWGGVVTLRGQCEHEQLLTISYTGCSFGKPEQGLMHEGMEVCSWCVEHRRCCADVLYIHLKTGLELLSSGSLFVQIL